MTIFDQPFYVVPYQIDQRPGSATPAWGNSFLSWRGHIRFFVQFPYSFSSQCNWPALSSPNDTLPYPLTEEMVKQRAYEMVYLWKEAQKGDDQERGSGANWQFLVGAHKAEYNELLKEIRIMDRHLMELYFTKANIAPPFGGETIRHRVWASQCWRMEFIRRNDDAGIRRERTRSTAACQSVSLLVSKRDPDRAIPHLSLSA